MKKKVLAFASAALSVTILIVSLIGASAAVYVQDGNFKYQIYSDNTVGWAGYVSDTADDVVLSRYYDGMPLVAVTNFAMQNNHSVRSVDFMGAPQLSRIGIYAFSGCDTLESVVVPDSITDVDVSAFRDCTALERVEFYGNCNAVPVECFYGCHSLQYVRLSARLESIQSLAFADCTSLEYLELLDTVSYIAPNAFDGDENLTLGVWYGSYAHTYAIDNGISYVLLDGAVLGDANGDRRVSVADATAIQRHAAEFTTLTGISFHAADVNRDGVVDISDATEIQRLLAEYEVDEPIGEEMLQ